MCINLWEKQKNSSLKLGSLFSDLSKEVPEQYYNKLCFACQEKIWAENIKYLFNKDKIFVKLNIDFMKI